MTKKFFVSVVFVGLAAPAFANDQLAQKAGVEPGAYTVNEMIQIAEAEGVMREHRIELIHKNREAFAAAVRAAADGLDQPSTLSTNAR